MSSFLIGFDPSLNGTGYAVLDIRGKKPKLVEKGTIAGVNKNWRKEIDTHAVRLALIASKTKELTSRYVPLHKQIFIERGFTKGNNATQAAFKARGALESELVHFEVVDFPPLTVKSIITKYGASTKGEVAVSVAEILGIPYESFLGDDGKLKEDESDATAVALAGWIRHVKDEVK